MVSLDKLEGEIRQENIFWGEFWKAKKESRF